MSDEPWRTSVTELVLLFRDVLRAIVEPLERAHVLWQEPHSYDQWDEITETLWQQIVIDAINYGITDGRESLKVPRYQVTYEDYSSFSFVGARPRQSGEAPLLVFSALRNNDSRFDVAQVMRVEPDGRHVSRELVAVDESDFVFRHRHADGSFVDVTELEIDE